MDATVVPLSLLVMFRWPLLRSGDFPNGKLQPYVGIGPSFFYSRLSVDFRPTLPTTESDWTLDTGLDVRAGLAWQFHDHFALLAEYRFTHLSPEFETRGCVSLGCALSIFGSEVTIRKMDVTLDTHHLLVGVSFRF